MTTITTSLENVTLVRLLPPSNHVFLLPPFLQKYRIDMPGSNSAFIPTINAITTSQDLQWMVQPTVITSMSSPYSRSHPYGHHLTNGPGILGHNPLARPGVIRSIGDTRGRRKRDEQVRDLRGIVWCVKDYNGIFYSFYKINCPLKNS